MTRRGAHLVGLLGSGAFFAAGEYTLQVTPENGAGWSQPLRVVDGSWDFQEITLTGSAAAIDSASIAAERERLFRLWEVVTPAPLWSTATRLPVDSYLEVSADYGVRRSYNGGPYSTYHEGVDFAAYGGTPVLAPAGGTVILAEFLYVRGGAVIIDHGLGVYSGFYHLSNILVTPGSVVTPGTPVGEVGTTGLSTGNHLHWDLLVGGVWVDAMDWHARDMNCWLLAGLALPCGTPTP
jgi:murein DD-endopeptidase MepM/ murein hydrolase activator NlpD